MNKLLAFTLCFGIYTYSFAIDANPIKFLMLKSDSNLLMLEKQNKHKWERNVWSEIDLTQKVNNPLFFPLNEIDLMETDRSGSDTVNGFTTLKSESIQWNLWNIIALNIMYGNLTIYCPDNPDWNIDKDNGYLNYPITAEKYGNSKEGTFLTDEKFRNNLLNFGLLGIELIDNYPEPMMSIEFPGEDSINSNGEVVYYPNPYMWYTDKDIIKYKVREKWTYNKKGLVTDKQIISLAPMVSKRNNLGHKVGEKELFWLDYNELKTIIKGYQLLIHHGKKDKLVSLFKYMNNRMYSSEIIKVDDIKITEK